MRSRLINGKASRSGEEGGEGKEKENLRIADRTIEASLFTTVGDTRRRRLDYFGYPYVQAVLESVSLARRKGEKHRRDQD